MAILIAFALVGCNVAPNVPRVTPYVTNYPNGSNGYVPYDTNGTYNGTTGNTTRNIVPGRLG